MGCCLSIVKRRLRSQPGASDVPTHGVQAPAVSGPQPEYEEQTQGNDGTVRPKDRLQDLSSSSGSATHLDEDEEMLITSMRATDVALGLRRVPAGFYAALYHSGLEWRTENKRLSVTDDVVEWDEPIPIPSDLSTTVNFGIYASFEFEPMLGNGERLRYLTTTVEQLLDRSGEEIPFAFFPEDGDVVSPCSSLSVTVRRRKRESCDPSESRVIVAHCSTTGSLGQLEETTNQGHSALSRYRKHGEKQDLERSIEQFKRALDLCPQDHPCRAAAQSNMAMAEFIHYRVDDADLPLDASLTLYRNALSARPVGHIDRPSTLIQLAAVHFARFEKRRDEVDAVQVEVLLHEAVKLSSGDSHENRAALSLLQLRARHEVDPIQESGRLSVEGDSALDLTDEDPWASSARLLGRFDQSGDLEDLQRAISLLEASLGETSYWDHRYTIGLTNLGVALSYRFRHLRELSDLERAISKQRDAVDLTPDGHPDKPGYLSNLGSSFLVRFQYLGDLSDLERAISKQKDAVELTPDSHPHKPDRLDSLGNSFVARFHRLGKLGDLEHAIPLFGASVDLTPDGHPDRPGYLSNLGGSLLARFHRLGNLSDLEKALLRQQDAVALTSDHHSDKPTLLNTLGQILIARFQRLGSLNDLQQAVSKFGDAVDLTPDGHPGKPRHLSNLGNSLFTRFQCLGELGDLEQALSRHKDAVELTPDGHPYKAGYLNNLGNSFLIRFQRLGELADLEQAISRQRDAVDLIPDEHPDKLAHLNNLGGSLATRFERLGELSDLEQAISRFGDAADLTPDNHPQKPAYLSNLGNIFLTRFHRLGELNDLEQAISRFSDAVDLIPNGHPHRPGYLNRHGASSFARFQRIGELSDLEQAISRQHDAVSLTSNNHPHKPDYSTDLGYSLLARFYRLGELSDLEQAISRFENAVELTPDGHPGKPGCLNHLGNSFRARFERLGEPSDLEHAISMFGDAVNLTPDGHPDKPCRLNNLCECLTTRFVHVGELSDIEQAISRQRDAVDPAIDGHKASHLHTLGSSFLARFKRLGGLSDLEHAISRFGNTVDLTPDGHPAKPGYLNTLGSSFGVRFEHLGEFSDLEHAISRLGDAVELTPDGHPQKPKYLSNLGSSFLVRFQHIGELSDLEQAITRFGDAVDATPDGHPHKHRSLNNLGNSLLIRFQRFEDPSDLEHALSTHRDVVVLTADGHADKPTCLNNLGDTFLTRFEHFGEPSDLEQALSRFADAVDLTPDGHPDKPLRLNNLGYSLLSHFEHVGELNDLEQAILRLRDAVAFTPTGHPDKPRYLDNLGNSFRTRFERLGELSDLEHAISLYSHATCASTGPISTRFRASQHWISSARVAGHHSLLDAYSSAIRLLPELAWIGLSLTHRYRQLIQGADVVREAAAAALDAGLPELAVEWLEQGRSVVWGELFQLRSSYDELLSVHPECARRLRELSTALEYAGATREKSLSLVLEQPQSAENRAKETWAQNANRHRRLAIERDNLLREIRRLPGFERFLLHKEFSQLCASAHSGPVVILNAAQSRCDALIVLADVDDVVHVPLSNFTLERSESLQTSLKSLLLREGKSMPHERPVRWETILSPLWKCVVKPVLDSLAISTTGELSRIFWCPTGPFTFLPIHAAGFYDTEYSQPGHKVSDLVVSSYVPTLGILTPSPKTDANSSGNLRFLTVRQPPSDGLTPLPGVHTELEHIKAVIQDSPSARTTLLESSIGTVEEVLDLMKEADWVHFACHGIQDAAKPTDSGLCLANQRRLKLSDIIALSRPRGGLAFLSACQTAKGDKNLSDEAVHIAAGMLFAGYGGVVGTMWSISDKLAPYVARDVYEQLFRNGARPDYREAARALHDAVGRLRDSGESFADWLPFIHVGL